MVNLEAIGIFEAHSTAMKCVAFEYNNLACFKVSVIQGGASFLPRYSVIGIF